MFNNRMLLSFSLCALTSFSLTLGKNEKTMTPIKKWEDVKPFAGKIVIYTNTFQEDDVYHIKPGLMVGYIGDEAYHYAGDLRGYEILRLKKIEGTHEMQGLVDQYVKNGQFTIREATLAERQKILDAINHHEAEFDFQCLRVVDRKTLKELRKGSMLYHFEKQMQP